MNWWIFGAVALGVVVLGYLAQRFGFIDLAGQDGRKSSGNGAGLIGIGDEVFAPARHEAAMELDRQVILPAPAPLAGDPDRGIYNGQVRIDLNRGANTRN
ncbi:MAG TPA: hypothetical protein DCP11_13540 [Microbacteriaceae bacterium]|jgi:hypothetical protein|nr:hypothetical protein [Microbacteriaceae bacterium]